jgi:NADH:ubiquinone oxidoreductase subunit F (NADH-binding)
MQPDGVSATCSPTACSDVPMEQPSTAQCSAAADTVVVTVLEKRMQVLQVRSNLKHVLIACVGQARPVRSWQIVVGAQALARIVCACSLLCTDLAV